VHRNLHGANSVAAVSHRAVFTAASWFGHRSAVASSVAASSKLSRVASFRAQLRSSFSELQNVSLRVALALAVQGYVATRSDGAACSSSFAFLRSSSVPNKPLVPTRKGEAPLLAAQRRRWAKP